MSQAFSAKTARVLVAEEGGSLRQLLSDTLRGLGYNDITVFTSGRDVFNALEREHWDWIIMPTFLRQPVNALHILKTICTINKLQHVRVSLFVDKTDEPFLPLAFEYGLLSCHQKDYYLEHVQKEMTTLLDLLKKNQWAHTLVAGDYLRRHMFQTRKYNEILEVERHLLNIFPGSINLLLKYGETQIRAGNIAEGAATLQQACLIDERAEKVVVVLKEKLGDLSQYPTKDGSKRQNILGIDSCVLIDPDSTVLNSLHGLLDEAGISNITLFENGEDAWRWLSTNKEPDLIIQEWRIPKLTGPLLLQRIRHHGFINVPINVISSVIKPEESHLLREFGVANVLAKPFIHSDFFKVIVWTLQQHLRPTEQNVLENKIRGLLSIKRFTEANRLRQIFIADPRIQTSSKKSIEAEFAYSHGKFALSRDLAIEALRLSGDSLALLNLIGKCLLKLGDYMAAMQIFEKAHSLSPMNIEHICHLAMCQHDAGELEESASTLQMAKDIDQQSTVIVQTECQIAILDGGVNQARELMEKLASVSQVVAYMNNRAVALTRSGRFEDGIKLYEQTIESIPKRSVDTIDSVKYNLGLAFARYGELSQAKAQLEDLLQRQESRIYKKAAALIERIKRAEKEGATLSFYEPRIDEPAPDEEVLNPATPREPLTQTWDYAPNAGDICLYGIYQAQTEGIPDLEPMWKSMPRYKPYTASFEEGE